MTTHKDDVEGAKVMGRRVRAKLGLEPGMKRVPNRTALVCWFVAGCSGAATRAQLIAFWGAVVGKEGVKESPQWKWIGERSVKSGVRRRPEESLQSLLCTTYGAVSEGFDGAKRVAWKTMNKYGAYAPLFRLNRGVYALTQDGVRRAAKGSDLLGGGVV